MLTIAFPPQKYVFKVVKSFKPFSGTNQNFTFSFCSLQSLCPPGKVWFVHLSLSHAALGRIMSPQNSQVEVPIPRTSECDCIWK